MQMIDAQQDKSDGELTSSSASERLNVVVGLTLVWLAPFFVNVVVVGTMAIIDGLGRLYGKQSIPRE
jgi:hypothetical protein